jgi:hemerythrin
MTPVAWDESFSIWDEELDEHHKQLIRYIRVLSDPAERRKNDPNVLPMLVQGLVDYAGYHFAAEEKRMRDSGYPQNDLEAHLAAHRDFTKDVAIFAETFNRGSPRLERVLIAYLTDWLTTHILTSDKQLGEFLRAKRA